MDQYWLNLLGGSAALIATLMWLPQARQTWRSRHDSSYLRGVSVGTLLLALLNAVLWAVYAFVAGAVWAGVPSYINMPVIAWTLYLVYRARRTSASTPITSLRK